MGNAMDLTSCSLRIPIIFSCLSFQTSSQNIGSREKYMVTVIITSFGFVTKGPIQELENP